MGITINLNNEKIGLIFSDGQAKKRQPFGCPIRDVSGTLETPDEQKKLSFSLSRKSVKRVWYSVSESAGRVLKISITEYYNSETSYAYVIKGSFV